MCALGLCCSLLYKGETKVKSGHADISKALDKPRKKGEKTLQVVFVCSWILSMLVLTSVTLTSMPLRMNLDEEQGHEGTSKHALCGHVIRMCAKT